jgi:cytidine deaminase
MKQKKFTFSYEVYDAIEEMQPEDKTLLQEARKVTDNAYAPYSHFQVAAVARLANGKKVRGTNQENASYPVGICAERSLLSTAATLHPNVPIEAIAISYHNLNGESDHPAAPCGMCRQALSEYQQRVAKPIKLILGGLKGKIYVIENANMLLPFNFSGDDLK